MYPGLDQSGCDETQNSSRGRGRVKEDDEDEMVEGHDDHYEFWSMRRASANANIAQMFERWMCSPTTNSHSVATATLNVHISLLIVKHP
jgi:hypothetical protein